MIYVLLCSSIAAATSSTFDVPLDTAPAWTDSAPAWTVTYYEATREPYPFDLVPHESTLLTDTEILDLHVGPATQPPASTPETDVRVSAEALRSRSTVARSLAR